MALLSLNRLLPGSPLLNVKTNDVLACQFSKHYETLSKRVLPSKAEQLQMSSGSTDFGNVTYVTPGCHPCYAIPTEACEQARVDPFSHIVNRQSHARVFICSHNQRIPRGDIYCKQSSCSGSFRLFLNNTIGNVLRLLGRHARQSVARKSHQ